MLFTLEMKNLMDVKTEKWWNFENLNIYYQNKGSRLIFNASSHISNVPRPIRSLCPPYLWLKAFTCIYTKTYTVNSLSLTCSDSFWAFLAFSFNIDCLTWHVGCWRIWNLTISIQCRPQEIVNVVGRQMVFFHSCTI